MRLVPCSPPAGIAYDALVDAPVTSIASALLAPDAAARDERAEPAWRAYWDLSEESGPYYLCADARVDVHGDLHGDVHDDVNGAPRCDAHGAARAAAWYRIDVQDELDAPDTDADAASARGHAGSVCLVGRWRRGEAAPVLYARETVQARVRAHGARRAASRAMVAASAATSAAAGATTGERLVGPGISDA